MRFSGAIPVSLKTPFFPHKNFVCAGMLFGRGYDITDDKQMFENMKKIKTNFGLTFMPKIIVLFAQNKMDK